MTEDRTAAFWDRMALRYSRSKVSDEASYRTKLQLTQDLLSADMNLLEVGCGTGSTALEHAPFVSHILATDISQSMLDIAADKAEAADITNVQFERASIETLGLPPASFDGVLAMSVLHLLDNRNSALAKIHDVLVPGGLFISSTMCLAESALRYIAFVAPLGKALGLLPNFEIFTADTLAAEIESHGFSIEQRWTPGPRKATFIIARKV